MTAQELRELDAWIAEHVMGWRIGEEHFTDPNGNYIDCEFLTEEAVESVIPRYSSFQHDAMDVLKKCAEKCPNLAISRFADTWVVGSIQLIEPSKAETLELAIAKFSKQLFSQTTK